MRGIVLGGAACVVGAAVGCLTPQAQAPSPSQGSAADVAPATPRAPPVASVAPPLALPAALSETNRGPDGAFAEGLGPLRNVHLAVDHDGVVVAASGGCTDDPGPLHTGTRDPGTFVLLAKLDKDGHRLWSKAFFAACGAGDTSAPDIAGVGVDHSGNIYVAGDLTLASGALDFGGGALADGGGRDAFVASFDGSGQHRWSKRFGNAADQRVKSVAVSPEGLVGITGSLEGTADFGNGVIKSAGKGDAFVAVFDASGQHVASHAFGDPGEQRGELIAFGKMGELTLIGPYEGAVDFGGGPLQTAKTSRRFLAQYSDNGPGASPRYAFSFSKALPADVVVSAVATGPNGTYLAGAFRGTADFGTGALRAHEPEDKTAQATDVFVARFDAAGKCIFSRAFGLGGTHHIDGLTVAGDLWMGGSVSGMTRFVETMMSAGSTDALLVRLDAEKGDAKAAWRFGDTYAQSVVGLASDGTPSSVYLVARSGGTIDFGTGPRSERGAFLVRMGTEATSAGMGGEPEPPSGRGDGGTR